MADENLAEKRAHAWKLIEKIRTCMFCVNEGDVLHSWPMTAYADEAEGAIYFLSEYNPAHEDDLRADRHVCLSFVEGSKYLSVSGDGAVSDDRAKIAELWNVFAQAWFDGPFDPRIRVIRVAPIKAEYWEAPGKLVSAVDFAIAAFSGARPHVGKDAKVDMR
jgi:general stress protein 26